jgi:hypothetical protein
MCAVPDIRSDLLRLVPDLLKMIHPKNVCTLMTRTYALEALALMAVPFVGEDEKVPMIDEMAAGRCMHRAVLRCSKNLASDMAIEIYRDLLVDMAFPNFKGNKCYLMLQLHAHNCLDQGVFEPPNLSEAEIGMVIALLDVLVKVTAFEIQPSPSSKFMALVREKGSPPDDQVGELQSLSPLSGSVIRSPVSSAAEEDLQKLSPLLQSLINLISEPDRGIDEQTVRLMQRVS